ncbi:hypothetical protein SAMN03097708_01957 [Thiohalomonas denitrificans]|uniref:Uncharacterized protein n=1 Tax=Thiohalomonas denitrificans TaxID=415747 RepID=A0A1G5QE80_9GAMM|nr:hypothetical protein SAMN03097708_01957 [Thiohalomonas denitrificans]
MTNRNWTEAQLKADLEELHQLFDRATRESRGSPDDILAQRLFQQLIRRRRMQIGTIRQRSACVGCDIGGPTSAASEPGEACRRA